MTDDIKLGDDSAFDELGEKSLRHILNSMMSNIEGSKSQLYDIYESAKDEVELSKKQLSEVRRATDDTIQEVDALERQEQEEKQRLVRVSSSFSDFSEERIQEAYDSVRNIQVQLGIAREKERQLRQMRGHLEARVLNLQRTVQGAERLAMRISSMLNYLSSQLSDVVSQIEAASKNKFLSAAIIQAQEEERLRVSREIHDGPAQDVATIMMESSVCERLIDIDPDEAKASIQQLRQHLRGCLKNIRQIIFDMRPMSLDDLGLVAAVEQLVRQFRERFSITISMVVEGEEAPLPEHVKSALFRIVQETLNNIVRHANTKRASLRMLFTESALSLLVEDEGTGFDAEAFSARSISSSSGSHFGVIGMRERAMIIGAEFSIRSREGEGTRVHLRLPLHPGDEPARPREETARLRKTPRQRVVYDEYVDPYSKSSDDEND